MPGPESRPRTRGQKVSIGFMIAWVVLWMAAMMIVLVAVGRALLIGDGGGPLPFLLIWLATAGFGLYQGVKALRRMLLGRERAPRLARRHRWKDDIEG